MTSSRVISCVHVGVRMPEGMVSSTMLSASVAGEVTTATTEPQKVIGNTVLQSTCMPGLSVAKIVNVVSSVKLYLC